MTLQAGLDKFLVEMNKAISLAGLTTLSIAFFPGISSELRSQLIISSLIQLQTHSIYSVYKYYGTLNIPPLTAWVGLSQISKILGIKTVHMKNEMSMWKQISIFTGAIAMSAIYAWVFEMTTVQVCCHLSMVFGIIHFYTMEIDYKFILQVRPYAYLPFVTAAVAIGYTLISSK